MMKTQAFSSRSSRTLVMKFGGTSVGTSRAIRNAAAIVKRYAEYWDNIVVVVSAMRGITEALLAAADYSSVGESNRRDEQAAIIEAMNLSVIHELFPKDENRSALEKSVYRAISELRGYTEIIRQAGRPVPYLVDAVSSLGERMNARLFSAFLREIGVPGQDVDATKLVMTDSAFMNASPLISPTRQQSRLRLAPLFAQGIVPVVTGFIGSTSDGRITTLGRGGSDYTATILGACLEAKEVWIWTDVAGVMTADPRLVPEAAVVSRIGYEEIHELANFGGRVLHPKTILPVRRQKIPIRVLHTFDPDFPGTLINHAESVVDRQELIVTLLPRCEWDPAKQVLVNAANRSVVPVQLDNHARSGDHPVSVVSLVGKGACVGDFKEGAYRTLRKHNVEVYGSGQTRLKNRFSLVVPDGRAQDALRWIHNEVVR